ncbi:MAG: hypothetical protein K1X67_18080 [Fimbriimonadaceae bacterium]|nr:hypothetical protein [Fimbriimonadaceae bacterium]
MSAVQASRQEEARLLLGDEAIALAALDAGITGAFGYPGTPSTEIFETIQAWGEGVWAQWSANEKVAYEEALGMSYVGKRALVTMKHVGLNVAADPFMSSALTGVQGGLVLVVADDPGMHSSQNEQDSRFYADFAKIPCFEPGNQQECYDMVREAFRVSERYEVPVMVRLVTRLAHSRSTVRPWAEDERGHREKPVVLPDPNDWTLVPFNARHRYHRLLSIQKDLEHLSEDSVHNRLVLRGKRGILSSGIATNYVGEALRGDAYDSTLHIGSYPIAVDLVREFVEHCDEIFVFEDGYPFIEQRLQGLLGLSGKSIRGKLDGTVPNQGELTPEIVGAALGQPFAVSPVETIVAARPPQLCKGCPHADSFNALIDAVAGFEQPILFSDIGCYTLAVMPPYRAVHSCVDMGASIGMAHGASHAGAYPVVCTIGDSTFSHSGLTPLMGAIRADADITVIILDNATTAMTGTQESMTTGEDLMEMLRGLGVKDLHLVEPHKKNHALTVETIKHAIAHRGLSVIVSRRACIHWKAHKPMAAAIPVCQAENENV